MNKKMFLVVLFSLAFLGFAVNSSRSSLIASYVAPDESSEVFIERSDYVTSLFSYNITKLNVTEWNVCVRPKTFFGYVWDSWKEDEYDDDVIDSLLLNVFNVNTSVYDEEEKSFSRVVPVAYKNFANDLSRIGSLPLNVSGAIVFVGGSVKSLLDFDNDYSVSDYCFRIVDSDLNNSFRVEIGFNSTVLSQHYQDSGAIQYMDGAYDFSADSNNATVVALYNTTNYVWNRTFLTWDVSDYAGKIAESCEFIIKVYPHNPDLDGNNQTINVSWVGAPYGDVSETDWSLYNQTINDTVFEGKNNSFEPAWTNFTVEGCENAFNNASGVDYHDYFGTKWQCNTEDQADTDEDCNWGIGSFPPEQSFLNITLNQTLLLEYFNVSVEEQNVSCSVDTECVGVVIPDLSDDSSSYTEDSDSDSFNDNRLKCDTADVCWINLTVDVANGDYDLWLAESSNFWVSVDNSTWYYGYNSNPKKVISDLTVTGNNLNVYLWSNNTGGIGYADRITLVPRDLYNSYQNFSIRWEDVNKDVFNMSVVVESPAGTNYTFTANMTLIDDFENITYWDDLKGSPRDGQYPVIETDIVKEDHFSLNLSTGVSKDANFQGRWSNPNLTLDVSNITGIASGNPVSGYITYWWWIEDTDQIGAEGLHFQPGNDTSGTDRCRYKWHADNLNDGWNLITFYLSNYTECENDVIDWTNFTYMALILHNTDDSDFDTFLDNMVAWNATEGMFFNGYNFQVNQTLNETGTWRIYSETWHDDLTGKFVNQSSYGFTVSNFTNTTITYQEFPYEVNNLSQSVAFDFNTDYVTNITEVLLEWNGTNYSASSTTFGSGSYFYNITNITIPLLNTANATTVNFKWYYTINYSESRFLSENNTVTDQNSQKAIYDYFIDALHFYNTTEYETFNISTLLGNNSNNATMDDVYISWNATNYSTTYNGTWYYKTITANNTVTNQDIVVRAWFNVTYEDNSYNRTDTLSKKQRIDSINITACDTGNITLNVTHYDEGNITLQPNNWDITIKIENSEWGFNNSNKAYQEYCVHPSETNHTGNVTIQPYGKDFFTNRDYWLFNWSANSTVDTISLYGLNDSKSTYFSFLILDADGFPYPDIYMKIRRYYADDLVYRTVAMGKSNEEGLIQIPMEAGRWYKYILQTETSTLKTTNPERGNYSTLREIRINETSAGEYLIALGDIFCDNYNDTFSNVTNVTTVNCNAASGTQYYFIWDVSYSNGTSLCSDITLDSSVTETCTLGNITDLIFNAVLYVNDSDGNELVIFSYPYDFVTAPDFKDAVMLGVIMLVFAVAMIAGNKPSMMIIAVTGIIWAVSFFRIIKINSLAVWGLMAMSVIILLVIKDDG